MERARKELKAFARVALGPGETRTVRCPFRPPTLRISTPRSGWIVEPIAYTAIVGRHALDPDALRAEFRVI